MGSMAMVDKDAFTLVSEESHHKAYDEYDELSSGHLTDPQTYLTAVFRRQYPELAVTSTSPRNPSLLAFAAAGHATAELDTTDEGINRSRGYVPGNARYGYTEGVYEIRYFAKYNYRWGDEFFIVYVISIGFSSFQFILKEPGNNETTLSSPRVVDELIMACGRWQYPVDNDFIYVYDYYWTASKSLWQQVQKASWDDVILNDEMKKTLVSLMTKFFDSEDIYKSLGVPWKRGVIFHGPAGNGKTISIKALMHSLSKFTGRTIPALYVKSAPRTYDIRNIFLQARAMAPCMLILEDIDTIVTAGSRSYFFNEVDGLENNDGIFMVASTNHLDRLDPGLASRPSRFDRKYLFPLPSEEERTLYCEYWRRKLKSKPAVKFPRKLCPAIAGITAEFSFAYLQEAFVATLLAIAGHRSEGGVKDDEEGGGGDLDDYELWREMKRQVKALRDDMDNSRVVGPKAVELPEAEAEPAFGGGLEGKVDGVVDPTKTTSTTLALRSKAGVRDSAGPRLVGHNRPVIFDREGNSYPSATGLPIKDGAPKDLDLFTSEGELYGSSSLPALR
ncbi:MAG: hypothetical protein Q9219_004720 [cf. Caloplaca sp. 3 TL-2023]